MTVTQPPRHWRYEDVGLAPAHPVWVGRHVHRGSDNPPRHDHDFWEVVLVLSGRAIHETDAGAAPLGSGEALVVTPGTYHGVDRSEELELLICGILPSLFESELRWLHEDPAVAPLLRRPAPGPGAVGPIALTPDAGTFHRCVEQLLPLVSRRGTPTAVPRAAAIGRVAVVLAELAAALAAQVGPRPAVPPVVRRAVETLEREPARPWRMDDLAEAVRCSKAYLTRQFTQAMALSPMAYLAQVRAARAAMLLRRTDAPIAEVAIAVGYPSPEHFSRRFHEHFRLSPSAYRRRHRPPA